MSDLATDKTGHLTARDAPFFVFYRLICFLILHSFG